MLGPVLMCRTAHLPPWMATSPCSHTTLSGTGCEVQPHWVQRVSAAILGPNTDKGASGWAHRGNRYVRRRIRRWQLSWRDGDHNPPHGSHYHLYLVKKLSSWMCLILITPYRTGPLQTGQTDR